MSEEQKPMEQQPAATPEEDKPKFIISIVEDKDGRRGILATGPEGQGMKLVEVRDRLQWALNNVADDLLQVFVMSYVDNLMKQKVAPSGFRPGKVLDFLRK